MPECIDVGDVGVWFLRAMLAVMALSSMVSGTLAYKCWGRQKSAEIWGILGRQYTAKMLRSLMMGWIAFLLPPTAQIANLSGFQWAWLMVELWSAITIWELGVWLKRRD
jgi:hypothetical protein